MNKSINLLNRDMINGQNYFKKYLKTNYHMN
jgi:hypothetical protein